MTVHEAPKTPVLKHVSKDHLDSNPIWAGLESRVLTFSTTATYKSDAYKWIKGSSLMQWGSLYHLYFMTFWCSTITVTHHYCAVLPTGKTVVQNNMLLYSLPINQETIERNNYKHCFKLSLKAEWWEGKAIILTKIGSWLNALLGFTFLSLLPFPASINCNVEEEYGRVHYRKSGLLL